MAKSAFYEVGDKISEIDVRISYQIIHLFSEGLYSSPHKAIEELVSNAFDAGANNVHVILPPDLVAEVADVHREWRLQRDEFERLWMMRSRRSEIETRLRLYRDREQELARLAAPSARRPDMV